MLIWTVAAAVEEIHPHRPTFREFMGLNGHTVQFRPALYHPVAGLVRDYHPVEWDLGKESDFSPVFPFARNGVNWSNVYGGWKAQGWRIDACLMFETVPRSGWKNLAADARKYAEGFARAFGPLGSNPLVESVEIGNEPGSWSDEDYRVLFENAARGLRAGDSRLRIASCALTTGKSHAYAKSTGCLEGLERLCDVFTIHTYAQLEGWPTWRRSFPEDPRLKDHLAEVRRLCAWRDEHAPGKEVWITEFGYDASTRAPDPQSEFKQWVGVTDEQQAQWMVRSWLLFSTLPVSRAYLYFFNDDDAAQVHGSSGLTRGFRPKAAFHTAAYLQRTLGDYRFRRVVLERPGEALVYEFKEDETATRKIWIAWSPTGTNQSSVVELPLNGEAITRMEILPLRAGAPVAQEVEGNAPRVWITETPLFIFLKSQ